MVDMSAFGDVGGQILQRIMSGTIIVFMVLILGGIIVGVGFYIRYLRQFNIRVRIRSVRNPGTKGSPIYKVVDDWGGYIYKKREGQKVRWFRLKGEKVDLPTPPLECLEIGVGGRNHINILQKSDEEYYYMIPDNINYETIVRNKDGKMVDIPVGEVGFKIVEGDVAYWNQLRKRDNKKLFDTESIVMKILSYLVPVLLFMMVIFMTYFITEHWGEFSAAAEALKEAAFALRDATTADVALSG